MTKTTIHLVAGIQNVTLIVFYTYTRCWQFRLINADGAVFGEQKLYYTVTTNQDLMDASSGGDEEARKLAG